MTLEAYQNTWLALMLAPQERASILAEGQVGLSPEELKALSQAPQARLEAIADAVQRGRISVLIASLPASLRVFLPSDLIEILAKRYAYRYPAAVVYPPAQGMYNWLTWLGEQQELRNNAPIQDLIAYELGLTQLVFYRKPTSTQFNLQPSTDFSRNCGPRLSPRTGLIVASSNLDLLLKALEAGQVDVHLAQVTTLEPESKPATQRQGWLLARWGSHVERFAIHWSVYALLGNLDGQLSWEQAVEATILEHPELVEQTAALMAWQGWFETKHFLV
jgi:hypothetical protein